MHRTSNVPPFPPLHLRVLLRRTSPRGGGRRPPGETSTSGPALRALRLAGRCLLLGALAVLTPVPAPAAAQGHDHAGGHDHASGRDETDQGHHAGLHFSHPLVTESVSPDTKVRLDHRFFDFPDGDQENSGALEAEYAVTPAFSIEAGIPYTYTATAFGNAEISLKFANFAFEQAGLLLGYGVGVGFPTNGAPAATTPPGDAGGGHGHDSASPSDLPPRRSGGGAGVQGSLGTDEWELSPFLNIGFKRGAWELVGWSTFGIPFQHAEQSEVSTEIVYHVSVLHHVSDRLQALVELDGSGGISGEAVGEDVLHLSPGLKFRPVADQPLMVGISAGFPLATGVEEDPFDARIMSSLFWHF